MPVHRHTQRPLVQILNLAGNHWICVSNVGCLAGHVNVFDSTNIGRTTKLLKQQIAWLLYSSDDSITLVWPNIKQQTGSSDCGFFAIANATAICSGVDSTSQDWDQPEMERHLVKCFQAGYMEMSPTATAEKPRVIRTVETTEEVEKYCACRQPDDGNDMIRRDKCHVSFHRACKNVMADAWKKNMENSHANVAPRMTLRSKTKWGVHLVAKG